MVSTDSVRFRQPGALLVVAIILFVSALPLAGARWYLLPVLLVPALLGVWAWRSGTDADEGGLRLRALLGQRLIPWERVAELSADRRGRALALLTDGAVVRLPAVPAAELPRLVAASGTPVRDDGTA